MSIPLEKIRELAYKIRNKIPARDIENTITEWLEQNQPSPQFVGLSDEQVEELSIACIEIYNKNYSTRTVDISHMVDCINKYLANQTFVQLKSQQSQPGWNCAPAAVEFQIRKVWIDAQGNELEELPICFYRPKPTPVVEVGQVWFDKHTDSKVDVLCVGDMTAGEESLLGVLFKIEHRGTQMVSMNYFLDKFEQVK